MDILGFLMTLAMIGIAPRFGVDRAVRAILTDARNAGAETFNRLRRQYVHMAAKPVITITYAAIAFQLLALGLAWRFLPHVDLNKASLAEGLADSLRQATIVSLALMLWEGICAYRSRLAIPHWLRNARGGHGHFPAPPPPPAGHHPP